MEQTRHAYSKKEEFLNILTHGFGFVLSVLALIAMLIKTAQCGFRQQLSAWIFGLSLVFLYAASTLYHAAKKPSYRRKLNILDHAFIYVLIAGTYTPFTLITLQSSYGKTMLATVWIVAIVGSVFKLFFTGKFEKISTYAYIGMGFIVVVLIKPLLQNLPLSGFWYLIGGGVSYIIGAYFYLKDGKIAYNHAIFHVFVLLGSFGHFMAVYHHVLCA